MPPSAAQRGRVTKSSQFLDGRRPAQGGYTIVTQGGVMLRWSAIFFIIALIAGAFGLYGVAGAAAGVAKVLIVVFLALFVISAVAGLAAGHRLTHHDDHLIHHH